MNASATIQGAPKAQAPDDGGYFAITVTGAILLDAGATIASTRRMPARSEIDLTAGGTDHARGGAGTNVLSAQALSTNGDGGTSTWSRTAT